jgi:uncharacterized membrane protein
MRSPRTGLRIAAVIFAIFALGHLLRLVTHMQVLLGNHEVSMGVSVIALIIASGLSVWMWRLSARAGEG